MEQLTAASRSKLLPPRLDLYRMGKFGQYTVFPVNARLGFYLVSDLYNGLVVAVRQEVRGL